LVEWAHRSGALPPLRITASWSRSLGINRIQVCGAMLRAQLASSPQIVQEGTDGAEQVPRFKLALTEDTPYKSSRMRPARPRCNGRPGWVRWSAWIWLFSSIDSTMAWAGGSI